MHILLTFSVSLQRHVDELKSPKCHLHETGRMFGKQSTAVCSQAVALAKPGNLECRHTTEMHSPKNELLLQCSARAEGSALKAQQSLFT